MKDTIIHIFRYGEAQIISDEINFKASISDFQTIEAVIEDIKSKCPSDVANKEYHVINIISDKRADYVPIKNSANGNNINIGPSGSIEFSDLDSQKLAALVSEFNTLKIAFDKKEKTKRKNKIG